MKPEWKSYDGTASSHALTKGGELLALAMKTPFGWVICLNDGSVDGYYRSEAFAKDAATSALGVEL